MAVHPLLPGLEVTVFADRRPLPDFEDPEGKEGFQDSGTAAWYIEAREGAHIRVKFQFDPCEFPFYDQSISLLARLDSGASNEAWVSANEIRQSGNTFISSFRCGHGRDRKKYEMHFSSLTISTPFVRGCGK
jgi:hypothetical protein